jgi:hypothetical protein
MGTVIHLFLESVIKGSWEGPAGLEAAWASCESRVENAMMALWTESHLVPLRASVPGYEIKKKLAFRTASNLAAAGTGPKIPSHLCEAWYQSRDGLVRGKVDSVITLPNGDVILVDYKTGPVTGRGEGGSRHVKPEYRLQMMLYASLFWATTGAWPAALRLVGLDGAACEVDFTPHECIELLESARRILIETNSLIMQAGDQLAVIDALAAPEPGTCQSCLYRPACYPYWEKRDRETAARWPHDLQGPILGITGLHNGRLLLTISPGGVRTGEVVTIRDVQPGRHLFPNLAGGEVVLYDLIKESDQHYREGPLTTCYPKHSLS